MINMTHRELCIRAATYLRNQGIQPFHRCQYAVVELERVGECPDAFGWGGSTTQLIEVKISRSDFLSDKKKLWRKQPEYGLGRFRSYLCPEGLISPDELPQNWGLLYMNGKKITRIQDALWQASNNVEEINLITSILRREGIKPRTFSYKNYKNQTP
jgi:hypothetical protein